MSHLCLQENHKRETSCELIRRPSDQVTPLCVRVGRWWLYSIEWDSEKIFLNALAMPNISEQVETNFNTFSSILHICCWAQLLHPLISLLCWWYSLSGAFGIAVTHKISQPPTLAVTGKSCVREIWSLSFLTWPLRDREQLQILGNSDVKTFHNKPSQACHSESKYASLLFQLSWEIKCSIHTDTAITTFLSRSSNIYIINI